MDKNTHLGQLLTDRFTAETALRAVRLLRASYPHAEELQEAENALERAGDVVGSRILDEKIKRAAETA